MNQSDFDRAYAHLVVAAGVQLREGQELYVRIPVEAASFAGPLAEAAYRAGARFVHVEFRDQASARARLEHAREETLTFVPEALIGERTRVIREGGASIAILGDDPAALDGVAADRLGTVMKAIGAASDEFRSILMAHLSPWLVISYPTAAWARRVYPELPVADAVDRLRGDVAAVCRLNEADPVAAWLEHDRRMTHLADWLTARAFDRFEYRAPGTELTVGMPAGQRWEGGGSATPSGHRFMANMPTDEVFAAPHRDRVEGTIRSTRPLVHSGRNMGICSFVVRDGRIVEATSERDQSGLEEQLNIDDDARRFGEIALVSEDAPVAKAGRVFYDGLYDENAGCHLAFGRAYPTSLVDGRDLDDNALRERGLTVSRQHFDFIIGSSELDVVAIGDDGTRTPILEQGLWSSAVRDVIG